ARDCAECETKDDTRLDRIPREITLAGPLTDEQRERLVQIAERCPVHRTLMGPKEIVTRLAEGTT
ncbi:MAG TPA: osmotically inducible protein C, partial [Thermoanaerobaculia bacterium]